MSKFGRGVPHIIRVESVQHRTRVFRIMPQLLGPLNRVVTREREVDLREAAESVENGDPGLFLTRAIVLTLSIISSRAIGVNLMMSSASGAPATMEVKVWGMGSLRTLFCRFDLTEEQFLAALDSDELGDMVGSIADDQVFIMRIRVSRSSFNGNWEGHVNNVTRAR